MAEFRKSAVKIMQGKRALFLTYLTVRDFMTDGFYRVDHLDVQGNTGMQRLLNGARARSFGNDIIGADEHNEAFLPTSVFLATSGNIGYDEDAKELFFDAAPHAGVCPLDVVDGQHRIEGLIYAAKEDSQLLNFPISAVITPKMSEAEKMLQFVVVNTKQRPVDRGVAQHITSRFTQMLEVEELPYLPSWLKKQAEKGDDDRALNIARKFSNDPESPWYGKIQFADEPKDRERHTITQATFVKSLKSVILAKNHPINSLPENKRVPIMFNYWKAVSDICVAQSDDSEAIATVAFKYTGLEFFHRALIPVINRLARDRQYSANKMKECLLSVQDYLPPEAAGVLSAEYWQSGMGASELSGNGILKLASAFAEAMAEAGGDDIQL